jgi:hypothetical protein
MKKCRVLVLITLFALAVSATAQDVQEAKELHPAMMYNFVKYIQWPTESEPGDFVIGVFGADDVYNTLKTRYDGKPKGSKKYVIQKMSGIADAASCAVVYLGKGKSKDFDALKAATAGKSILTITDNNNLGKKGSCVNFREIDGKLKFEINQASITAASLKISSSLLSVAIVL